MKTLAKHYVRNEFQGYKKMIKGWAIYLNGRWGITDEKDKQQAKRAVQLADAVERYFDALEVPQWTEETKVAARAYALNSLDLSVPPTFPSPVATPAIVSLPTPSIPSVAPQAASVPTTGTVSPTFTEAVDAYIEERRRHMEAGKISMEQLRSIKDYLKSSKTAVDKSGKVIIGNTPLNQIRRNEIETIVAYWYARPISSKTGEKIAPITAKHTIDMLRTFFDWADGLPEDELNCWNGYKNWRKAFKVKLDDLKTVKERKAKGKKERFTLDELIPMYRRMTYRIKCYALLALNCGMGAKEIATLRVDDVDLKAGTIDRLRNKTGVEGKWKLWDETVKYLKICMKESAELAKNFGNKDELAILSRNGKQLVHFGKTTSEFRTDSVAQAWGKLLNVFTDSPKQKKRRYGTVIGKPLIAGAECLTVDASGNTVGVKVRRLGFYALRRTAAQAIREIGGYETHKIFLAHSTLEASGKKSTSEKHYSERTEADFAKVNEALATYHAQLAPMFDMEGR